MTKRSISHLSLVTAVTVWLGACATSGSVDRKIAESQTRTEQKIETVAGQVEELQTKQQLMDQRVEELGRSAAEALQRAEQAGVLAKGKVAFQQTFTEDRVRFRTGSYDLSKEAEAALDDLATRVKALEGAAYIEIQGHTDDTGGTRYNDMLGENRADAVRRYLSRKHNIPLGRMSTISYGDTLPVASNKTRAGRAQNRRVVVVVLE